MTTLSIQIDGLKALTTKLGRVAANAYMGGVMQAAAAKVQNYIAEYPAASEANSPANRRWYQRGYGPKWRTKKGQVHGRKTSQTLGRRWTTKVYASGMAARIGNNTPYGPFVQSAARQAGFHKARGWRTDKMAVEANRAHIARLIQQAVHKELSR